MKSRPVRVFGFCPVMMFCSSAYLPVLDVGIKGIAGYDTPAYAMDTRSKDPDNPQIPDQQGNGSVRRDGGHSFQFPEPSRLMLIGAGAFGMGIFAARKSRRKEGKRSGIFLTTASSRRCLVVGAHEGGYCMIDEKILHPYHESNRKGG